MAKDDNQPSLDPAAEITQLKKTAQFNKHLMLAILAASLVSFSVLLTATGYFYVQLTTLKTTPSEAIQAQFKSLESNLKSISYRLEADGYAISGYHLRINLLQEECSAAYAPQRTALFLKREQDYQKLLDEIAVGAEQLTNMTRGSKTWLKPYYRRIEELKKRSLHRSKQWADKS